MHIYMYNWYRHLFYKYDLKTQPRYQHRYPTLVSVLVSDILYSPCRVVVLTLPPAFPLCPDLAFLFLRALSTGNKELRRDSQKNAALVSDICFLFIPNTTWICVLFLPGRVRQPLSLLIKQKNALQSCRVTLVSVTFKVHLCRRPFEVPRPTPPRVGLYIHIALHIAHLSLRRLLRLCICLPTPLSSPGSRGFHLPPLSPPPPNTAAALSLPPARCHSCGASVYLRRRSYFVSQHLPLWLQCLLCQSETKQGRHHSSLCRGKRDGERWRGGKGLRKWEAVVTFQTVKKKNEKRKRVPGGFTQLWVWDKPRGLCSPPGTISIQLPWCTAGVVSHSVGVGVRAGSSILQGLRWSVSLRQQLPH